MKFPLIFFILILFTTNSYSDSKINAVNTDNSSDFVAIKNVKKNKNSAENSKIYNWQIIRVVDGDTLEVANEFLPAELKLFVRIKDIDTPEKAPRSKCLKESMLAQKASNFTKQKIQLAQINNHKITFSEIKWDKYGGRILARVKINDVDLGQDLIDRGLAREYFGDKKKSWCY